MNIIAINGSHKGKGGYTHFLVEKLLAGAEKRGASCEEIILAEMKINTCKACNVCQSKGHFLRCIYEEKDDVAMIFDKMRKANIIVYATPIYVFGMSGLMKVFFDRMNATGNSNEFRLSKSGLFFRYIIKRSIQNPL